VIKNKKALMKLRVECENALRNLSFDDETTIEVKKLAEGHDLRVQMSRGKFESICAELF